MVIAAYYCSAQYLSMSVNTNACPTFQISLCQNVNAEICFFLWLQSYKKYKGLKFCEKCRNVRKCEKKIQWVCILQGAVRTEGGGKGWWGFQLLSLSPLTSLVPFFILLPQVFFFSVFVGDCCRYIFDLHPLNSALFFFKTLLIISSGAGFGFKVNSNPLVIKQSLFQGFPWHTGGCLWFKDKNN